ncbi:MAG: hypothetical protein Kow00106_16870 [Anaerolineae bacterium]
MAWWRMSTGGHEAHVNRIRTEWVRAGVWVRYGPVAVTCLGLYPRRIYGRGARGAAGIVGEALLFTGQRSHAWDARLALAAVRRVSLVTVRLRLRRRARALTVHHDSPDGWRVMTLIGPALAALGAALADACDLPLHDAGDGRDDFGPDRALRLLQDIYGEWHADRTADLYLAPDRLLFDWRTVTSLAALQRLDVYQVERGNPLLRVTYAGPDGAPQVEGFEVREAGRWAEALTRQMDVPLEVHRGRKRKTDFPAY